MGIERPFWRAVAVYQAASLVYAAMLLAHAGGYERPVLGWLVIGVMAAWTAVSTFAYSLGYRRGVLVLDVLVTVGCLLSSTYVQGPDAGPAGVMPVTATWVGGPVLAWAVYAGRRAAGVTAIVVAAADLWLRGFDRFVPLNGAVLLVLAGVAVGHVVQLVKQAEERLQRVAEMEAAGRERQRLARDIHDSVLQVLTMVQRRGMEIGGESAELGRLAGEQERALRELVRSEPAGIGPSEDGSADVARLLRRFESEAVTVSTVTASEPLLLPAHHARELEAAAGAALDNVRRHCPSGTRAWVLVEGDTGAVTVTVRDEGPGIPPGRLEEARAAGRLGVAQSMRGRLANVGGTVRFLSVPGQGTEVELSVPVTPRAGRPRSVSTAVTRLLGTRGAS
ncbi:DUF5931 domain-containing protein [Sphaerisporangium sp. TRM90804]|uniref:MacS family sensor histidine kinase n=1 Tax=Sphaerisporangium sp. TRM90804 TaxID=3031113 RepID=UPI0024479A64|nr:DUF5931 domain-containing protein [Sphaerisporangium sp. TRM90804]MDH2429446.1 DUF5931 domain-containing protein [Sphaerisporangium sp. TRM90804]